MNPILSPKIKRFFLLFFIGGALYGLIEILWRGYTPPSMPVLGGLCFFWLDKLRRCPEPLCLRCIKGALLITLAEGCAGLFLNRLLGLSVWDYSRMPGNILGQICPFYSICWYFLCYPAFWLLKKLE